MPLSNPQSERRPHPCLVVFFGMTASGKSTLAMAWAQQCGVPYYNTDRVRKELAGLQATDRRPDGIDQGIYSPTLSALTYETMLERAREDLAGGVLMVVLDGSYSRRSDRDAVRRVAEDAGADCRFCYCYCSEKETKRRLAVRANDSEAVSDGRWEIFVHQQGSFELPKGEELQDCLSLDTKGAVSELLQKITAQPCR
ncbi:MAG: AAA family ATPase [Desulfobulbus sp.]